MARSDAFDFAARVYVAFKLPPEAWNAPNGFGGIVVVAIVTLVAIVTSFS